VSGEVKTAETDTGRSASLAGKGWLEIGDDRRVNLETAFTLDAWIRPGPLPGGGARIIDKCHVGTDDGYMLDTFPGNALRLITPQGCISFDAKLEPGRWAHVAATLDQQAGMCLYLNGKKVASGSVRAKPVAQLARISKLYESLRNAGLQDTYEGRHARLVVASAATVLQRRRMLDGGRLKPLEKPESRTAAERSYVETVGRLAQGLQTVLDGYAKSEDPHRKRVLELWRATAGN
jgi:hypothetical protein